MKRWQFIISLSILLVLVCCKHPHEPLLLECQGFNEVFEKRDAYPDSALAIFRNIQDTIDLVGMYSRSPQQFFDYQVLNAELVYKNDQTILNDSLVLEAAEFYDSIAVGKRMAHKQLEMDFMRARAYYYAGVVKVQREQYIEALEHYLSVLRIMDKLDNDSKLFSRSEKNAEYLHFTGLTFNRIGWVFYVNDLWDEVKEALELANERFRLEGEVGGMLSNYAVLGEIMLTKGNREAATEYYRLADSLNNIMVSRPDCIDCELNMALLAYAKGQKQEAYEILYEIMSQNEDLSTSEELGFHIGRFYYEDHAYDSALHYLGDGFQKFSYQTMASLEMIIAMCDSLGYEDKVAYYSQCLARVSLGRIAQLREGSKLSLLFDSYLKERDNSRKNRYIYLVISFLVLAFVTLVIVDYVRYRIRKKRYKTDSEAYEKQRLSLEREIEKAQEVAMQQEEKIKSMEAELRGFDDDARRACQSAGGNAHRKAHVRSDGCQRESWCRLSRNGAFAQSVCTIGQCGGYRVPKILVKNHRNVSATEIFRRGVLLPLHSWPHRSSGCRYYRKDLPGRVDAFRKAT